jgi:HSP20 family protein
MAKSIRLTRIVASAHSLAEQLQNLHFGSFQVPAGGWRPSVNVYAHKDRLEVCVELAGMPKEKIDIQATSRRLVIRGNRLSPERDCDHPPCGRILMMEISEGAFERVLEFPVDVDPDRTVARQENGWLWITLPLA